VTDQEFNVCARSAAGIMNYRVTAKDEDAAVFKAVQLHRVLGWPLQGEVKVLDERSVT
jgi:hypothetical protein